MMVFFTFEAFVTVVFTLGIITTNVLILMVTAWTDAIQDVNRIFFVSMTVADLCIGLFIAPFSIVSSFSNQWVNNDDIFCHIEAYLLTIFFIAGMYSMTWINVDHYLAVRKPQRYRVKMSVTRSVCWIGFAWVGAISFCCPPLFSLSRSRYYGEAYICSIDRELQKPYFVTAGILVMFPAVVALTVTNGYLFTKAYQVKKHVCEHVLIDMALRPKNYRINFVVSVVFLFTWLPWCVLKMYGLFIAEPLKPQFHFYFLWIAIGNSFYKFFVYLGLNVEFRRGLRQLCGQECTCSPGAKQETELHVNFVTVNTK